MKGLGIGNKRLQHNIVDLFPGSPTDPDRWSLHGECTCTHTHTHTHTHTTHTYEWLTVNLWNKSVSRGVFRTQTNTNDRTFCANR